MEKITKANVSLNKEHDFYKKKYYEIIELLNLFTDSVNKDPKDIRTSLTVLIERLENEKSFSSDESFKYFLNLLKEKSSEEEILIYNIMHIIKDMDQMTLGLYSVMHDNHIKQIMLKKTENKSTEEAKVASDEQVEESAYSTNDTTYPTSEVANVYQ